MLASRKQILIVEDEEPILKALAEIFVRRGFSVLKARNGEEGLSTALRFHPNLILLDIVMPRMDGLTMIKQVRRDFWGNTVPIIILTNMADPLKKKEAQASGIKDFWIKTEWDFEDLFSRIAKRLKETSTSGGTAVSSL